MGTIFSRFKDPLIDLATERRDEVLRFPLKKTGYKFNDYHRGDFIVVGGRKTSGKSSFILNNYVTSPIHQRLLTKDDEQQADAKILYLSTKRTLKSTIEKMIVNYYATQKKGIKVGVPSLYGYSDGGYPLSKNLSKSIISKSMDVFDRFAEKGHLRILTGRKRIAEVEQLIQNFFDEFGSFDEEGVYTYKDEFENSTPIVVIDDASGIIGENNTTALRNDSASALGTLLKQLSKVYDALIVLSVPSTGYFSKGMNAHISNIDELGPYASYCDRSVILHNPAETNEKKYHGYEVDSFINDSTGICYMRSATITSNYMGASGVSFNYFMYPENGYMMEMPPAEHEDELEEFEKLAKRTPVKGKKKKPKESTPSAADLMAEKDLE